MSSVESRIVTMKFENTAFEKGVTSTLNTLARLKDSLSSSFSGGKGLDTIGASAEKASGNMAVLGASAEGISAKFVALSTIAVTALANISQKAFETGADLVKSMSGMQAASEGFSDYELKIGATQTIMAGTGENIQTVSKYLKELDTYADKTVYNLSDMVSNIGKFTNAGVKLPVATHALIGVANVAARSGATASEAARAMYNLGQAIGQGKVRLMDWKSVELANMGTKEFKEQLIDAAVAAGTLTKGVDGSVKTLDGAEVTYKNFTTTLEKDWLTADVLTDTLGKYADQTTAIGKKSWAAAQNVKTFSMMMETLRAAAGTGWTDTFEIVIGSLPKATKLWTGLTNEIGGFIGRSADARNAMLADWRHAGGRVAIIDSIKNVWEALGNVLGPIHDAFREIFPKTTGWELARASKAIRDFTENLKLSPDAMDALKRTFKGLFAVFHIFTTIIGHAVKIVFSLFDGFEGGHGGILSVTASIGDMIVAFDKWLSHSKAAAQFFDTLGNVVHAVLVPIIGTIVRVEDAIGSLLSGDISGFTDRIQGAFSFLGNGLQELLSIGSSIGGLFGNVADGISGAFQDILSLVQSLSFAFSGLTGVDTQIDNLAETGKKLGFFRALGLAIAGSFVAIAAAVVPFAKGISEIAGALKDFIVRVLNASDATDALAAANTLAFIGVYRTIKKYVGTVDEFIGSWTGTIHEFKGAIGAIRGTFDQLTGSLKTMQNAVRAKMILNIAIAVALLAASIAGLAFIPADKIGTALAAITGLIGGLVTSMMVIASPKSGLGKSSVTMLAASTAMIAIAGAVTILAAAMLIMEKVDPSAIAKTMVALAGLTAAVVALGYASPTAILGAAALLILAPAMALFAGVLKIYEKLDWGTVWKGIGMMVVAIASLGLALTLASAAFPGAVSMLVIVPVLYALAGAIAIFGNMDMDTLKQGIIAIGAALAVLAIGGTAMALALPGAFALLTMAAALTVIMVPLKQLGEMSTGTLLKIGLAIAGLFLVLAAGAAVITPVLPMLLGLAAAMMALGLAMALAGVGMFAFGTGFALLAATGSAGTAVLTATIIALLGLIPLIAQQIGLGIVAIIKVVGASAGLLMTAFAKLVRAALQKMTSLLPDFRNFIIHLLDTLARIVISRNQQIGRVFEELIRTGLTVIRNLFPDFVQTGIAGIMALLDGITRAIPRIGSKVTLLVNTFLHELASNGVKMARGAADALIDFLNGLATAIREKSSELFDAGRNIADAVMDGLIGGLTDFGADAVQKAKDIAGDVVDGLGDALGIGGSPSRFTHFMGTQMDQGLINGMSAHEDRVVGSAYRLGDNTVSALRESMDRVRHAVDTELTLDPRITPILDLSRIQNESSRISALLASSPLSTDVTYSQARSVSAVQEETSQTGSSSEPVVKEVNYTQNLYSPKAISAADAYRGGKSLLSLKKEELGIT